jgi:hypothetical protein
VAQHLEQLALGTLQLHFPGFIKARAVADDGELGWGSSDSDMDDGL